MKASLVAILSTMLSRASALYAVAQPSPQASQIDVSTPPQGFRSDDASALAEKLQNPIADLISVPFQNNSNFNVGP
jgi:hypothetical protein